MNKILSKEVSLQLAKLLFEKQIVIDTEKIWLTNAEYGLNNFVGDVCIHWMEEQGYRNSDRKYNAPTIAEVIDFIFEKYGTWIDIYTLGDENVYPKWNYRITDVKNVNSGIEWELKQLEFSYEQLIKNSYNIPIEAYEEAIKYVLNKEI